MKTNDEWKQWCLERAGEDLPADAQAWLEEHPDVREEMDRLAAVAAMISLKRHEEPDPHAVTRCVARVGERIREDRSRSWLFRLEDLLTGHPAPVAAAAAALLAVGLGAWLALHGPPPGDSPVASAPPTPAPVAPVMVAGKDDAPQTNRALPVLMADSEPVLPTGDKPIVVMRVESNTQPFEPGGLEFGTGGTVPVRFDY